MRKLFWCGLTAGVLALGSLFTATYYAYCQPDSLVGRCFITAANASLAVQPVTELVSMIAQASHLATNPQETAGLSGCNEECIPEDPQPIAAEPREEIHEIAVMEKPGNDVGPDAAPIVIHEEDPMPPANEIQAVPATVEIVGLPNGVEVSDPVCPMVMPYCTDDEEQAEGKRVMPYADDNGVKPVAATEESEDEAFKAWMKLIEASDKDSKDSPVEELPAPKEGEELPAPKEGAVTEPKWQEDSRIHEHYSGCPSMTCPYTGKSYPSHTPSTRKSGKEESSEEPALKPKPHRKKHSGKGSDSDDSCPHTEGVDTMEYRPSDGGLNEYGPGPM